MLVQRNNQPARVGEDLMAAPRIQSYREFWPYYLAEHSRPATRRVHLVGTGIALALLAVALLGGGWWWLLGALVAGYGFAWFSHMTIEHNRPATFTYPLWSLASDFRMFFCFLAGRLQSEVDRHHVGTEKPARL